MKPVELAKDIDLFVQTLPSVRNGYPNRDKVENERDEKGIVEASKKHEKKNFVTDGNSFRPQILMKNESIDKRRQSKN